MARGTRPQLDVPRLRLLREVGLRGSIGAAARAVGLTGSAVSQQLAALERECGTELVRRSPRGVALTPAGQLLADHAGRVLDLLSEAAADLARLTGSIAGVVRVASVASVAATAVSTACRRLAADEPSVEVHVVAAEPERGIGLLLRDDVDLAVVDEYDLVPVALPDSALVRELGQEPLAVLGPLASQPDGSLAALREADWVMPPADAACGRAVRAACRIAGFEPRVRWETDDMALLVAAVAAGHGVSVLPLRCLDAVGGAAARVGSQVLHTPTLRRRVRLVARAGTGARPAVEAVAEAITEAATGSIVTGGSAPQRPAEQHISDS